MLIDNCAVTFPAHDHIIHQGDLVFITLDSSTFLCLKDTLLVSKYSKDYIEITLNCLFNLWGTLGSWKINSTISLIRWKWLLIAWRSFTNWSLTIFHLSLQMKNISNSKIFISCLSLTTYPDSGVTEYVTVRTLPSGNKTEYCPDTWDPSLVSCWLKSLHILSLTA